MAWLLAAAIVAGIAVGAYIRRHQYKPRSFKAYFPGFKPMVASHRGYGKHGPVAENTVQAFLASEDLGFHAHELDVRRTRDNALVLLHGPRLENTTDGKGRADTLDLDMSGSGRFADIAAARADVTMSGSGRAIIAARDQARVRISGSATVRMPSKPPQLDVSVSGSGHVVTD